MDTHTYAYQKRLKAKPEVVSYIWNIKIFNIWNIKTQELVLREDKRFNVISHYIVN